MKFVSLLRCSAAIPCLICVTGQLTPQRAEAQTDSYLQALAVPPHSVGTCMPSEARHIANLPPVTVSRLVMVSLPPGSRREMSVTVDRAGRPVRYDEMLIVSTSMRASRGDDVIAAIDTLGRVRGLRLKMNTWLPDNIPLGFTPDALRAMREGWVTASSHDTLSAGAQRQVSNLAQWLRRRCPA